MNRAILNLETFFVRVYIRGPTAFILNIMDVSNEQLPWIVNQSGSKTTTPATVSKGHKSSALQVYSNFIIQANFDYSFTTLSGSLSVKPEILQKKKKITSEIHQGKNRVFSNISCQ